MDLRININIIFLTLKKFQKKMGMSLVILQTYRMPKKYPVHVMNEQQYYIVPIETMVPRNRYKQRRKSTMYNTSVCNTHNVKLHKAVPGMSNLDQPYSVLAYCNIDSGKGLSCDKMWVHGV